jgi:hypothetical protein
MNDRQQIQAFADDLDRLVDRYRDEWEISMAGVIGALEFKQFTLMQEAQRQAEDEEDTTNE